MVKKLFSIFMCLVFILILGGCSAKPGVAFDGKSIWTDPSITKNHQGHKTIQEFFEKAITAEDADLLLLNSNRTDDKSLILDFQEWLSQLKISPLDDQTEYITDSASINKFYLYAGDKCLFIVNICDNGDIIISPGLTASYSHFYSIDNFEDVSDKYHDLVEKIQSR